MPTMKAPPQDLDNAEPPEEMVPKSSVLDLGLGAEDCAGHLSTTSAQVLFAEGAEAVVIAPNPTMSMKSSASIRKSALPPKAQAAFERCMKDRDIDASEIAMEDVLEGFEMKERAVRQNRQLKYLVVALVVAVILLCAGAFASSFAAVQLSKEARISQTGAMVDINSANGDKNIVQVAPATDSQLQLMHALVLDEAHLRTMDEIVYNYYPSPGVTRTRTTKVLEVERDVGLEPWEVNVTIKLEANSIVTIRPLDKFPLMLLTGGKRYALCGKMRCSNFKVDDPDLDVLALDQKMNQLFQTHPDPEVRRLQERKLFLVSLCVSALLYAAAWELERFAMNNYGCCSSKIQFAVFKSVDMLKQWKEDDDAKCQDDPSLHNFVGPSEACFGHDVCLSECAAKKCGSRTYMDAGTKLSRNDAGKGDNWKRDQNGDYTVYDTLEEGTFSHGGRRRGDGSGRRRMWAGPKWGGKRSDFHYDSKSGATCFAETHPGGVEDCNCKVECDKKLVAGLQASECDYWAMSTVERLRCKARKLVITAAMEGLPNKCK